LKQLFAKYELLLFKLNAIDFKTMYYLSLYINDRKFHICHLAPQIPDIDPDDAVDSGAANTDETVFEFLIPNTGNENNIFTLLEKTKFIATQGINYDKYLKDTAITGDFSSGKLSLFFDADSTGKRGLDERRLSTALAMRALTLENAANKYRTQSLSLVSAGNNRVTKKIEVLLQLKVNQQLFGCKLVFHIADPSQIYDVIFDFGSEASQISIAKFTEKQPRALNVINRLEDYFFEGKEEEDKNVYHQYDPSEPELYKSIFFIKKQHGQLGYTDPPNLYKERDLIKVLTKKEDQQGMLGDHFITPNLKLSELVDYFNEYIKFEKADHNPAGSLEPAFVDIKDDIYRSIINRFIHIALAKINKGANTKSKQFFNVVLLVPNVYTQNKVYKLIKDLYKDLNEYCKAYNFAGCEIQTLSESDASFIGMLADSNIKSFEQLKPQANYLIVDAGKGTMDISIIRVGDNDRNFSSLYRAGIAGSGHIITYAFIETLAAIWMGRNKTKRRSFIYKVIKANTADQLQFLDVVERLKKRYSSSDGEDRRVDIDVFKSVIGKGCDDLKSVTEFLQKELIDEGKTIQDYFSCISIAVHGLSNEIDKLITQASVKDFEKVILAGRAFRFTPFVEAVVKKLPIKYIAYDAQMSKKICIVGATSNKTINYNSNLIGLPIIKPIFSEEVQPEKPKPAWLKSLIFKWNTWFNPNGNVPKVAPKITEIDIDADFFLNGFSVNLGSFNVHIGGHRYTDNFPPELKANRTVYNIFFNGKEFKVRTADNTYELTPSLAQHTVNDPVWKSIFPFLEWNESQLDDVPVEEIGEEYAYYYKVANETNVDELLTPTDLNKLLNADDDIMDDLELTTKITDDTTTDVSNDGLLNDMVTTENEADEKQENNEADVENETAEDSNSTSDELNENSQNNEDVVPLVSDDADEAWKDIA
jgi:hypothetical protein